MEDEGTQTDPFEVTLVDTTVRSRLRRDGDGWRMSLTDSVWQEAGVVDVTDKIEQAARAAADAAVMVAADASE